MLLLAKWPEPDIQIASRRRKKFVAAYNVANERHLIILSVNAPLRNQQHSLVEGAWGSNGRELFQLSLTLSARICGRGDEPQKKIAHLALRFCCESSDK